MHKLVSPRPTHIHTHTLIFLSLSLSHLLSSPHCSVCERGVWNCTKEVCPEVAQCPGSLVFSPRSCLLTCSSLDAPGQASPGPPTSPCQEPRAGCVCPQGTVLLVGPSLLLPGCLFLPSQHIENEVEMSQQLKITVNNSRHKRSIKMCHPSAIDNQL